MRLAGCCKSGCHRRMYAPGVQARARRQSICELLSIKNTRRRMFSSRSTCVRTRPFSSAGPLAQRLDAREPSGALRLGRGLDGADQRQPVGPDADKPKNALLEAPQTMTAEPETIDPCRHSHSHDGVRAATAEPRTQCAAFGGKGKAGAKHLFAKGLQERWQRSEPQRKNENQVLRRLDGGLCSVNARRRRRVTLPSLSRAKHREVQRSDVDNVHLVSLRAGTVAVGLRQSATKPARI